MRFRGLLKAPRLDIDRYKQLMREQLGEAIKDAAVAWLGATAADIPVWSGASVATFSHLASKVNYDLTINQPGRVPNRVSLGLSNSTGDLTINEDKGEFTFTYTTSLPHLIYNEYNNANLFPDPSLFSKLINPGPYRFQQKGAFAFQGFAASVRLPDIRSAITVKTIRVN